MARIVSPEWSPALAGGRSGHDLVEGEAALWRREPGDRGEDHERDKQVHDNTGEQHEQLLGERGHGEGARVVGIAVPRPRAARNHRSAAS